MGFSQFNFAGATKVRPRRIINGTKLDSNHLGLPRQEKDGNFGTMTEYMGGL